MLQVYADVQNEGEESVYGGRKEALDGLARSVASGGWCSGTRRRETSQRQSASGKCQMHKRRILVSTTSSMNSDTYRHTELHHIIYAYILHTYICIYIFILYVSVARYGSVRLES